MPTRTPAQIPNGNLTLEAALYEPDAAYDAAVVVCHPHPQRGGDMRSNVVMIVVQTLVEAGIAAIAFNFRGVGASGGSHDNGDGEVDDVRAALTYARALAGVSRVGLAGYSFGAGMAAQAVDEDVSALALISGPGAMLTAAPPLAAYQGPVLLIAGDGDRVSNVSVLHDLAQTLASATAITVPGADHFWWGNESQLTQALRDFFVPVFSKSAQA